MPFLALLDRLPRPGRCLRGSEGDPPAPPGSLWPPSPHRMQGAFSARGCGEPRPSEPATEHTTHFTPLKLELICKTHTLGPLVGNEARLTEEDGKGRLYTYYLAGYSERSGHPGPKLPRNAWLCCPAGKTLHMTTK